MYNFQSLQNLSEFKLKPEEKSPTESEPVVGRPRHRADGGGEHDVPGPDQVWLLYRAQEVTGGHFRSHYVTLGLWMSLVLDQ